MYFVNQASLSHWHSISNQATEAEVYAQLIHKILIEDLGGTVLNLAVFDRMKAAHFTTVE